MLPGVRSTTSIFTILSLNFMLRAIGVEDGRVLNGLGFDMLVEELFRTKRFCQPIHHSLDLLRIS